MSPTKGKQRKPTKRKVSRGPAGATVRQVREGRARRAGQANIHAGLSGSTHVTAADGNVFADLGFAADEAENLKLRADLMMALRRVTDALTQVETGRQLGISQSRVSELRRGRIDKFTIDALVNLLARAGIETRVSLRRTRQPAA